jgi:hypothetical protein
MDRLTKWAKGEFIVAPNPPPPPPSSIEQFPVQLRPTMLTKASLESAIGAPLFPGIEISWNAELDETYDFSVPFTINDKAAPGDLTKHLSLPWQSNFYECRTYW